MSKENKPAKGKILHASTAEVEGVRNDSILLAFEHEGQKLQQEFTSPFMNDDNMQMWRKIVIYAVTGTKLADDNASTENFANYQSAIVGQDVFVVYNGEDIVGIGRDASNIFYPAAYGMR